MEYLNFHIHNHIFELEAAILFLETFLFVCLMGNGDDIKKIRTAEMEKLSLDISTNRFSKDLLQSFIGITSEYEAGTEDGDEIELNLGLSLGGRFGVDKTPTKLVRSSSIASCLPVERDDNDAVAPPAVVYAGLVRTSSLPVETENEWRKRKELQTLRRMEAKRRRSEKLRNAKGDIQGGGSGNLNFGERKEIETNLRRQEREKLVAGVKRLSSSVGTRFKPSMWASQAILGERFDAAMAKGKGNCAGGFGRLQGYGKMVSQGSRESKEGSSSSLSDLESKTLQGSRGELSPASILSLQERSNQEVGSSTPKARENQSKTTGAMIQSPANKSDTSRTRGKEIRTNAIEDMPCVSTTGDGPNGRRVDGILYKYGRGEEVRIMCVCHGSFHSPAEFVMHAGGTDLDHPLKHIIINPNSSSLL